MKDPNEVEEILSDQVHPTVIDSRLQIAKGEKYYQYMLEFNNYKTLDILKNQINRAEDAAECELSIVSIKPVVRQTDSSIEARLKVVVEECINRYAEGHTQLSEFENDS